MSSNDGVLKLAGICIFGGGYLVVTGVNNWRKKRRALDVATSKIESAPQGLVELQGFAWPSSSVEPMENLWDKACVFKRLKVQQYVHRNKNSSWETISTYESTQPFYLIDKTGVVKIIPTGFDLHLQEKKLKWEDISIPQRKKILSKMESGFWSSAPPLETGFFSGSYRCIEEALLIGSPVLVHGNLWSGASPQKLRMNRALQDFYSRIKKSSQFLLRTADLNKDGVISEEEAIDGMYSIASKTLNSADVNTEIKKIEGSPLPEEEVILKGVVSKHDMYASFIADCHQENLVKRLGSWGMIGIWSGAALIIAGAFILLNMFHSSSSY